MPKSSTPPATDIAQADLTPQQRIAAFFDAMGRERNETATIIDVSEKTISRWRKKAAYKTEVERWQGEHLGNALDFVRVVKVEMLDAGRAATRALLELLEAEDSDGEPLHGIRIRAAERLLETAVELLKAAEAADAATNPGATAGATVNVVITREDTIVVEDAVVEEL